MLYTQSKQVSNHLDIYSHSTKPCSSHMADSSSCLCKHAYITRVCVCCLRSTLPAAFTCTRTSEADLVRGKPSVYTQYLFQAVLVDVAWMHLPSNIDQLHIFYRVWDASETCHSASGGNTNTDLCGCD